MLLNALREGVKKLDFIVDISPNHWPPQPIYPFNKNSLEPSLKLGVGKNDFL